MSDPTIIYFQGKPLSVTEEEAKLIINELLKWLFTKKGYESFDVEDAPGEEKYPLMKFKKE